MPQGLDSDGEVMMQEVRGFLKRPSGQALFCTLHSPRNVQQKAPCVVILASTSFEEKVYAHRALVEWSRAVVHAADCCVLRFDFWGEGESDGEFSETSFASRIEDLKTVLDFANAEYSPRRLVLAGTRLSAAYIASFMRIGGSADGLILFDPLLETESYVMGLLRLDLARQMTVHRKIIEDREVLARKLESGHNLNIDGYELGKELFCDLRNNAAGLEALPVPPSESLIFQFRRGMTPKNLELVQEVLGKVEVCKTDLDPWWKASDYLRQDATAVHERSIQWLLAKQSLPNGVNGDSA